MKSLSPLFRHSLLLQAMLIGAMASPCLATDTKAKAAKPAKPAKAAAPVPTNAAPVQVEIPKSVFIVPTGPQEGKDPFFPLSTRLYGAVVVKNKGSAPSATIVDLKLKGFSGTTEHPLAIINNRTFAVGEEGSVSTPTGRVPIRCVEIKPDSVVVVVNGQERILHLRVGS
jgi:hypothetical protein